MYNGNLKNWDIISSSCILVKTVINYNLCTFSKISIICCTQVYFDDFSYLKTIYVYINQGKKSDFFTYFRNWCFSCFFNVLPIFRKSEKTALFEKIYLFYSDSENFRNWNFPWVLNVLPIFRVSKKNNTIWQNGLILLRFCNF